MTDWEQLLIDTAAERIVARQGEDERAARLELAKQQLDQQSPPIS